ncbi:ABC transporter substrate-binding protein [Actinacidiphila bryophytorum]|uniref:ABC transporter substrate-binding protein n=1 Tax=Actinacidiphila bryophytorum TaxID=1436133 RepID=UPI002176ACC4|nr:Tat pathway signal sequence domain protein [Actinacidiphila bryophytorum]UWE07642.1 Tat pathway signal sequence domain protein [Actinacidiphila bryophytorum]
MSIELNRRSFVNGAVAVAGAAAMSPLIAACGGGGGNSETRRKGGTNSKKGAAAALPAYVPSTAVQADIPSTSGANSALTDPGFLKYPATPVKSVPEVPGAGGHYTTLTPLWGTIPAANNSFYQAMNKALGATLTMKPANGVTYNNTIPTLTAARKLPDWVQLPGWWNSNFKVGELCGTQLADLTPYLAGDKVKKYPNLAALPTGAWSSCLWQDKLYGIPSFATGFGLPGQYFYRGDVFEAKGINADDVKSCDDLLNLGKELTDAKGGVWAFDDLWPYIFQMFDFSQKFTVTGGKLVHKYEQPEFIEALNWCYKVAKSGYVHPDALAGNNNDAKTRFYAGKVLITADGQGAWNAGDALAGVAANKNYRRASFKPFSADGTKPPRLFLSASAGEFSYLNANLKPAQIEECLRIANYLAAPYGTVEYAMVNFGVEGVDYTMGADGPAATKSGIANVQAQTYPFLATPVNVISNPGFPKVTQDRCAWNSEAAKYAYKPVFWNMNITVPNRYATADAGQAVEDTIKDVYHGIKPVSAFQDALSTWKGSGGGDALVAWYQTTVMDKLGTGQ